MNRFSTLVIVLASTVIISACGTPAVPTVNPVDVQNTAVAAAFTMVAETQAAIPTNTPLPPTETPTQTPQVTNTPLSLPTLDVTLTATQASAAQGSTVQGGATVDPCSNRVLSAPKGRETIIRIVNTTKVAVTVSLYLNETASHGECGYRGYNLSKNNDVVITDLVQGCYNLWAWSDDPKGKFNSSGSGCINNPDKWTFEISEATVKFVGP
jgi:hypothetical protein